MRNRKVMLLVVLLGLSLGAFVGCGKEESSEKASVEPMDGKAEGKKEGKEGIAMMKADSKLRTFAQANKLRYSMTELSHFADRGRDGSQVIDLGNITANKNTNGGWRAGWRAESRKDGAVDYYEADSKSARVFFKHDSGNFDRIVVRMKAVKSENKVVFYLNDNAISNTKITGDWADYEVKIPREFTRKGENQLLMRFTHKTTSGGRGQVAHVDKVFVLADGAKPGDLPSGNAVSKVKFQNDERTSLIATSPQSYTYRIQLPDNDPKLALSYGAKKAGAQVKVKVNSDRGKRATILEKSVDKAETWNEEILDLSGYAGQIVEVTLDAGGNWEGGQALAWGEPGVFTPPVKDGAKEPVNDGVAAKNVVIYLIDTLRYDKITAYNPKSSVKTPNLDAFAKDGTLYEAAYDTENWTKPSTATILTGLYPETHKAKEDVSKLPQSAIMLSEHLQDNGFKTGSFIANGYVSDAFGFKQGWDHYTNYIREKRPTDAGILVKEAMEWVDTVGDERFFAYIHTIDPHVPYSAPKGWKHKFADRNYDGHIKPQATGNQLADIKKGKLELNAKDKRYLEKLYDEEIAYNDAMFGKLIEGLKERKLYDNTLIIVLVDHGEEFWDHGSVGHGHNLHEELVHTPLLVRYPNKVAEGRRVKHVVSAADVFPTVSDVVGLSKPKSIEGNSFADTFDGIGDPHPRIAVSDFLYRKKAVRAGRYHWLTIGRGGSLFDIEKDRLETKDLIKKHAIARAYSRSLFGVFMGAKDKTTWWSTDGTTGTGINLESTKAEIDDTLQKQLEALGYVDGAEAGSDAEGDKKRMEEEDNK